MLVERSPSKKPGFFKISLFTFNVIAATLLLIAQAAPMISPARYWFLEIIAISYPFLLFINILFIVMWGIRLHRFAFISLAVIIIGYDKVAEFYRPTILHVDVTPPVNAIKVMSYNVRLFDLYNWKGNSITRKKIFDFLGKETPDVINFQEYYSCDDPRGNFNNNDTLPVLMKTLYRHIEYGVTVNGTNHWGIATFCKYPIVGRGKLFYEEGHTNFGIYTDMIFRGDTLRVYNVHLQSNFFKEKDYKFISNPDSGSSEEIYNGSKSILKRLKKAVIKRSEQVDELKLSMNACPYPYILCGDFNDPPFSYAYQKLHEQLLDCYLEKGSGFGTTYIGTFPPYRIDYILHSNNFQCFQYEPINVALSDHRPVIAWLGIIKK